MALIKVVPRLGLLSPALSSFDEISEFPAEFLNIVG